MKKESIFTKEGVFGCDDFNLRFWRLRRSTLLRKVFSAAVEIRRRFLSEEVWSSSGRKKQVDFSQRLGKTGRFLRCLQKQIGILNGKEKHSLWVFLSDVLKLFTVVSEQAFSILPMIFLSYPSWRRYCRGLRQLPELFFFLGKDQRTVTVTKF